MTTELTADKEELRAEFERLAGKDSFNFARSRKGTYRNPAIARDWKWFQKGVEHQRNDMPPYDPDDSNGWHSDIEKWAKGLK